MKENEEGAVSFCFDLQQFQDLPKLPTQLLSTVLHCGHRCSKSSILDMDGGYVHHQEEHCNLAPTTNNLTPQPIIVIAEEEDDIRNAGASLLVGPEDVVGISTVKRKVGIRGRKLGRAKIMTSSPNKEDLEYSIKVKDAKVATKKRTPFKKIVFSENPGCSSAHKRRDAMKKSLKRQKEDSSS
ncbi:hypothetical protein QE152_g7243 [Popillia japonica]|uniref:Uncharacterized protein n=1 Tax=Popillia japonica TaxID=7064 RepID=A0AAW1MBX2_POPJA